MNAFVGQTLAELRLVLRDKTVLLFSLFFPVVTVAFFGYLNQGGLVGQVPYASYLVAGGVGMVVSSAALQNLGTALARQRELGILKRLGGTPLRVQTLVGAKVAVVAAFILAQTVIMVALNVLLFHARLDGNPVWTLVALILGIVSVSAMGIALAGLCRNADIASAAGVAVTLPMQFLCGTLFPIEAMPSVLRFLAKALPLTYFVNALRGAMVDGGGPIEHSRDWFVLLACLAVAVLLSIKTFRWE